MHLIEEVSTYLDLLQIIIFLLVHLLQHFCYLKRIKFFLNIVEEQNKSNPHYIAIGSYKDNKLNGFLTASSYINYYDNHYVMDVRDCIIDLDNTNNAYVIYKLFDDMIERIKEHGGKHWRADSVRDFDDALRYGKLLNKRYKAKINISVRGEIGE